MSGEDLLRLYVYALLVLVILWAVVVVWLVGRTVWCKVKRRRR